MTTPTSGAAGTTTSRWAGAALIVLLLAALVAVLIGIDDRAGGDRSARTVEVRAAVGEPVRVGAVVVTVLSIDAARAWQSRSEFPDVPLSARGRATIVVITYRIERDPGLQVSCTSRLLADDVAAGQQEWEPGSYGDRLAGPDGLTYCSAPVTGPGDGSIVTEGYEIPERYADGVAVAIDVDDTRVVVPS